MKKTKWLLLLVAFIIAAMRGQAQNINRISAVTGYYSQGNQVFDAAGNMYFIAGTEVMKLSTGGGTPTVFAGNGTSGYSGDGGAATNAELRVPDYLAIDNAGNIYIADYLYLVRKVNTSGIISTIAGTGTAGTSGDGGSAVSAELENALSVAVDPSGNLYIGLNNYQIRKVNTTGTISNFCNSTGLWTGGGTNGDGGPATAAKIGAVYGMSVDPDGNYLYIADLDDNRIRRIDLTTSAHYITNYAGSGDYDFAGDGAPPGTGTKFAEPSDVRVDCENNVYIFDQYNWRIREVSSATGNITTIAGDGTDNYSGDTGPAASAEIRYTVPGRVSVDNQGHVYIQDLLGSEPEIRIICNEYTLPTTVTVTADPGNCTNAYSNTFHATLSGSCATHLYYDWYVNSIYNTTTTGPDFNDPSPSYGNSVYCIIYYNTNAINSYCTSAATTTSNIVYEVGTTTTPLAFTGIDINTICAPSTGTPTPQFTTNATGGVGTITYHWSYDGYSNAVLNNYNIYNPTVVSASATPGNSEFLVTATDSRGCQTEYDANLKFISGTWDLATKDDPFDLYLESATGWTGATSTPSPLEQDIWHSADIWNRLLPDGATNSDNQYAGYRYGLGDYIYVKVRNVGCIDFNNPVCTDMYAVVNTYWTLGGFGGTERWLQDWTSISSGTGPSTTLDGTNHIGGSCSSITITSTINAGYSAIIGSNAIGTDAWYPPDLADFTSGYVNMHLCYLSRIVDYHNGCADPGMTITEVTSLPVSPNVNNNNNISTRNTDIVQIPDSWGPRQPSHIVFVGQPVASGAPGPKVSVQFGNSNILYGLGSSSLSSYASFKVKLGALYDAWVAGGSYGNVLTTDATEKSVTFDGSTTLTLDSITLDTGTLLYPVTIIPSLLTGVSGNSMPLESIIFRSFTDDTGLALGSYTFDVRYDTTPPPKGAMAITEVSQGPNGYTGCEYVEALVSVGACDTVSTSLVDIRGFILDDNSGNFDLSGCALGYGITRGHYRLTYDSIWQYVPVGSKIVFYNQAVNCYNLSDTFYIDTANLIYYVPVPATAAGSGTYVLQRYSGVENLSMCSYCSDTGTTVYTNAANWAGTIDLNNTEDGVQLRCPGCTTHNPGTPAFYQGIGYAPTSMSGFTGISSGAFDAGGCYVTNSALANRKYTFMGTTASDFTNPLMWTDSAANTAGSPPSTLGNVDATLAFAANTNTLGLPCCGGVLGMRHGNTNPGTNQGNSPIASAAALQIKVYPNPANMQVYFEYPLSANISIQIMDITGRLLSEQTLHNTTTATFDVSNYTPGLYLYHITADDRIQTGKILIN